MVGQIILFEKKMFCNDGIFIDLDLSIDRFIDEVREWTANQISFWIIKVVIYRKMRNKKDK